MNILASHTVNLVNSGVFPYSREPRRNRRNRYILPGAYDLDVDVQLWYSKALYGSGSVSSGTLNAVNTWMTGIKSYSGLYDSLIYVFPFCGNQLAAAITPLINKSAKLPINHSFVNADYSELSGLKGDGSTKYIDLQITPSFLNTTGNAHFSVYLSGVNSGNGSYVCGATDSAFNTFSMAIENLGIDLFDCFQRPLNLGGGNFSNGGRLSHSGSNNTHGFWCGSHFQVTGDFYFANSSSGFQALVTGKLTSGLAPSANNIFVFATNEVGTPAALSAASFMFFSVGSGLDSGQAQALYTYTDDLQTALGRRQ